MKIYICHLTIISLLCCLLVSGKLRQVKNCGKSSADPWSRVQGGSNTKPGQYPWMVSIHYNSQHVCGGVILSERWILTAAHCIFSNKLQNYEIHAGTHRLSKKNALTWKIFKASEIFVHKNYNGFTFQNDLALIRTRTPMNFDKYKGFINAICLPATDEDPTGWATVTGWGRTKEGGVISDILQAVNVPLVPRSQCRKSYRPGLWVGYGGLTSKMICAGMTNKGTCQGDSGSSLMQMNKKGVFTLIGIVSHGQGCGRKNFPAVNTKVGSYLKWLEKHMF